MYGCTISADMNKADSHTRQTQTGKQNGRQTHSASQKRANGSPATARPHPQGLAPTARAALPPLLPAAPPTPPRSTTRPPPTRPLAKPSPTPRCEQNAVVDRPRADGDGCPTGNGPSRVAACGVVARGRAGHCCATLSRRGIVDPTQGQSASFNCALEGVCRNMRLRERSRVEQSRIFLCMCVNTAVCTRVSAPVGICLRAPGGQGGDGVQPCVP